MKTGTLQELRLKKGDVAECITAETKYFTVGKRYTCSEDVSLNYDDGDICHVSSSTFRIISRALDTPKLWRDMSAEEKGALLLAAHEGKMIEQHQGPFGWQERVDIPMWQGHLAYRVKPDDVRKTTDFKWRTEDDISGMRT